MINTTCEYKDNRATRPDKVAPPTAGWHPELVQIGQKQVLR